MDTRIYVHGRPQGQDIWSPKEDSTDRFYLSPFLDSRVGSDVDVAMIIDVWQKHFYYTYIHCKNVTEKSVRPNAYFAITIRFDGICKNVASLFNLVDIVYNKVCLGNIIANENGQEHILVNHWIEKESVLQQINSLLSQNIEKVILSYISTVENTQDTKDAKIQKWSFQDIDSPLFLAACQKYRIVVSPQYKSKDAVHDEDMKRVVPLETECNKLKDQIDQWKSKYEFTDSARALEVKKVQDLTANVAALENKVKSIREEVSKQFDNEISKLKSERQKVELEMQEVQKQLRDNKQKYDDLQKKYVQLEKKTKNHGSIENDSSKCSLDVDDFLRRMAEQFPELGQKNHSLSYFIKKISPWLFVIHTVLLIVLVCISIYIACSFCICELGTSDAVDSIENIDSIPSNSVKSDSIKIDIDSLKPLNTETNTLSKSDAS